MGNVPHTHTSCIISFTYQFTLFLYKLKIHLDNHPRYTPGMEEAYEKELFIKFAESKLILTPGKDFAGDGLPLADRDSGHFRMSYSTNDVCVIYLVSLFLFI